MTRSTRFQVAFVAALAALITLSGCSASGGSSADSAGAADHAAAVEEAGSDTGSDATESAIITTGDIAFTTDDPIAAAGKATDVVLAAAGRVDARDEYAPAQGGDEARAVLTVRVPAASIEQVRAELAEIAKVDRTTLRTEEVGATQRDLEARAASLRTSVARYDTWLAAATEPADLMELEAGLAERQTELENLEAQIASLTDKVAMSTFTLTFSETPIVVADTTPENFGEGVVVGWNGFVGALGGISLALGLMLPWLVVFGLVGGGVWWFLRRRKARATAGAAS